MKIKSLMVHDPITIAPKTSIQEAIEIMKLNSIRHLPVVGSDNFLCGFVTLANLRQGLIPSMLTGISLKDLMIKDPFYLHPDDDIEVAAQIIYKHKISGMPVISNGKVVGIITETDILRTFIDMMGMINATSRVDVVMGNEPRMFQKASKIINDNGGDILTVSMTAEESSSRTYYFRLSSCKTEPIKKALEMEGFKVLTSLD
ncbi:MAG: CBS domain-containing protein [Desulfobacterales bacterium]|nr:CBS domain-containing protein [Desulfobacterales bacterium]